MIQFNQEGTKIHKYQPNKNKIYKNKNPMYYHSTILSLTSISKKAKNKKKFKLTSTTNHSGVADVLIN